MKKKQILTFIKVCSCFAVLILITSCKEESCTSCIAQSITDKTIIETRIECDKSDSYLSGWRDGFRSRYADRKGDVEVICD
jgi:hypothetical protein